jgi:glycosyltransferase involved in cell wall biosynthesis
MGTLKAILVVGRVEPRKNIGLVFNAFSKMAIDLVSSYEIIVIGPLGWHFELVIRHAEKLGILSRVRFLGKISDDELFWWLNNATMLIHPSLEEGFGFPPLEAMACGLPVIISSAPALVEVSGDAAIVVSLNDENSMMHAISSLIRDKELRSTLTRRGLEHVKKTSWKQCANSSLEAYKRAGRDLST